MSVFLPFALAGLLLIVGLPLAMFWDYRRAKNKKSQLVIIIVTLVIVVAVVVFVVARIAGLLQI